MVSPKVQEALAKAQENPVIGYKTLLNSLDDLSPPEARSTDLKAITDDLFAASHGVVTTKAVLSDLINVLKNSQNHESWIDVGTHIVRAISSTPSLSSSLVDQASALRELIATAHETNEDFLAAAKILAEIPLDSSQRRVSDREKAKIWIRIVRNHLEEDDSTTAETYLNKLKNVMHKVGDTDPEMMLHFKLSAARIQDSNRQFLQAASSYHDISFSPSIAEEERLHTLSMAIKCAVLAPAGPLRSRALGRLHKDERSAGLEEYGILEKMFFDRLLSSDEVEKFAQSLAPHQLAKTSDGSTVLARAVVEHNLLSAGRLYTDIGFDELGLLLGLDGDKAEETTAKMIEQGRLTGSIDQIDRIIYFEMGEASGEYGSGHTTAQVGKEIRRWDSNVQALAEDVERVTDLLQAEFPDFVATQIAV
ncbi:COP9/signalosome complex subunit Csn4 [Podospora pseudocomata]|uniref:COP9 signalosome complex subunit 4 n=1 Tax=Podospora pseudocomata TaxID=2093779 RepID=A0ABR0GX66_9PEZI|nr:COP9/signalosome complex subunit Csn4 [Podospora pseudocomata]